MSRPAAAAAGALLALALAVAPGGAGPIVDRVRIFSIQGLEGGDDGDRIAERLKSVSGVHGAAFDLYTSELKLTLGSAITDRQVLDLLARGGVHAVPGPGRGRYAPQIAYPGGVDVKVLSRGGAAVGPLERLRVPGKITIFDAYADWCIACRPMDERVRAFARARRDVAVRKLDVARWDSPLAKEFGPRLTALPHLVVFTPDGKRHEFDGATWEQVKAEMRWR